MRTGGYSPRKPYTVALMLHESTDADAFCGKNMAVLAPSPAATRSGRCMRNAAPWRVEKPPGNGSIMPVVPAGGAWGVGGLCDGGNVMRD